LYRTETYATAAQTPVLFIGAAEQIGKRTLPEVPASFSGSSSEHDVTDAFSVE
jgi:hypothetical protein